MSANVGDKILLSIETVTTQDAFESLLPEWDELAAAQWPRLPFQTGQWALHWWRNFRRQHNLARDLLRIYVVRDQSGRLVAVAPMMLTLRPGIGPVRTRELQFFGADKNITEVRGLVCNLGLCDEVMKVLRRRIAEEGAHDWVQWRGVRPGPEQGGIAPQQPADEALCNIDYILPVWGPWENFRSGLPRNIRESLRKCYNSLRRDGHAFDMRMVTHPEDVAPALETFFALHANRAHRADTITHPDVFGQPEARAFLIAYCEDAARRGELRIFQMVIAGKVVACRIGLVLGNELYLYYSGYDCDWGRYSVMTTVVAEAIRWSIANGICLVNLSTGSDVSKMRWRPHAVPYRGWYEPAENIYSRTAFRLLKGLRSLRKPPAPLPPAPAAAAG